MKVIGFAPMTVRIELEACELPGLQDQLFTAIEASGGSLREELSRHPDVGLPGERVEHASNWLLEYRNLLSQIGEQPGSGDRGAVVTTPAAVADEVVRACCSDALERLASALSARASHKALRARGEAVRAWVQTLVDLRCLDEGGIESIDL
jgi:hypothetical protein